MSARIYYTDACTFPLPAPFADRSVNILEWRTADDDAVALVVQREPLPPAEPGAPRLPGELERFVADQIRAYPAQFAGYALERNEVATSEAPFEMRRVAFRWRSDSAVLYHHQAYVLVGDTVMIFTGSAKAAHRAFVDEIVDGALADLRVRGD